MLYAKDLAKILPENLNEAIQEMEKKILKQHMSGSPEKFTSYAFKNKDLTEKEKFQIVDHVKAFGYEVSFSSHNNTSNTMLVFWTHAND